MSTRDSIIEAIKTVFKKHRGPVNDATTAVDVAGWDSLGHVQLMFDIEQRVGKEIDVTETYALANVGELVAFVDKLP